MAELLSTSQALARIGWKARSSLWRAERAGRIARARTINRRPFYLVDDVQRLVDGKNATPTAAPPHDIDQELEDEELASLRAELGELLARGELEGVASLRLMAAILRRGLVVRAARGDAVSTAELGDVERLERRIHQRETFERLRELTREK